jgi:hypothetical protein
MPLRQVKSRLLVLIQRRHRPVPVSGLVAAPADDLEEAVLAPVGAPGVAADPVVRSVLISAPAVQLDGVVDDLGTGVVHVHATGVFLDAGGVDVGRHRAAGVDLRHDLMVAHSSAVLLDGDNGVFIDLVAVAGVIVAVHAHVNGRTLHVDGLVLLASQVGDAVLVHPGVGSVTVAALAGAGIAAVDQSLHRGDDVASLALGLNLDAIRNGGEGRVSPAGAAVHGDVLVEVHGKEACVAVVQGGRQILLFQVLVRSLGDDTLKQRTQQNTTQNK